MARRRKGIPIHGWLIVDKPAGISSNAVVGRVRRCTGAAKVGHGGTLDPLATGILPLALGEATKTVSYVMDGAKGYRFTVRWGERRDTDDGEGAVIATSSARPTRLEVENILGDFIGDIEQTPPIFSAIKVDGKRAYALARGGEDVALKPRRVRIERFDLVDMPDADHATFTVTVGKGTYIRALARDLALKLGTVGYVAMLRRTCVGPFDEKSAISLDNLETLGHSAALENHLLAVATALDDIPALALTTTEATRLAHGRALSAFHVLSRNPISAHPDEVVRAMDGDRVVALAKIVGGEIRPLRVLNL
ncbi:tRNA pseudouridine(55) synthase TruB [Varunaivibrio sulfuroxidans]|uniref:tRNA pseudouridine synthase B n=1 Tax=Varunaivibrio sulfuroxidans TaxID=1773489 RepID=A0A4V2UP96_9PROT|nr:tRNA pseudouridine(55) synthase TruB [Varunaivibrio sulfuroxidans]TCS65061.1 tRNA pseudouridine synthase B [Varunaivibrio sulfuroxidans]WES29652.1 tRNA pseudouridine(55) synthase TruB [Varunaivibrio sulfuroxidans]